jgi:predicted nucleic acid-binding Zn ribbon protein
MTVVKPTELSVPTCLACGEPSPSWSQACSSVCAAKIHERWIRQAVNSP